MWRSWIRRCASSRTRCELDAVVDAEHDVGVVAATCAATVAPRARSIAERRRAGSSSPCALSALEPRQRVEQRAAVERVDAGVDLVDRELARRSRRRLPSSRRRARRRRRRRARRARSRSGRRARRSRSSRRRRAARARRRARASSSASTSGTSPLSTTTVSSPPDRRSRRAARRGEHGAAGAVGDSAARRARRRRAATGSSGARGRVDDDDALGAGLERGAHRPQHQRHARRGRAASFGVRERIRVPWPAARIRTVGAGVTQRMLARTSCAPHRPARAPAAMRRSWGAGIRTPILRTKT